MTSPNFAFPQPTDDELAAQGPAIAPTDPPARATLAQPGGTVYPGPTVYGGTVYGGATGAASVSADAVPAVHRPVQTGPVDAAVASGTPGSSRLGRWALLLALAAAGISLIASAILGVTAGPAEAATGSYFGDDAWYTNLGVTLFSVQALCTVAGLTGLVLGIVAAVSDRGRTLGIIATAVSVVAPIVSFALFLILSFAFL